MSSVSRWMAVGLALLCVSCGKQSPASLVAHASSATRVSNGAQDLTKPYLTDDKMQKFINSMQESENPFNFLFGKGGKATSLASLPTAMAELEAFARKYGFEGYEDYTAVWGRIATGEATIMGEEMMNGARDSMQKSIQNAQEELKKPSTSPEMAKMYQEQIASYQESLEGMKKSDDQRALNDADLALVKKYKTQIEEAEKKYSARK